MNGPFSKAALLFVLAGLAAPAFVNATSINTLALCGNAQYCVYTDEGAFVTAVGSLPLGQENFGGYPPANYNPFGVPVNGNGSFNNLCSTANNYCGNFGNPVPNGSGNYVATSVIGSVSSAGGGLAYVGFNYDVKTPFFTSTNFSVTAPGLAAANFTQPLSGFFGVVSSAPSVGVSFGVANTQSLIDNVLWANGPGISQTNPLYPDSGGGCGTGKVCWFWPTVLAADLFFDPAGANAYTYQTLDGSLFTTISGFPSGFSGKFDVSSGATDFGLFGPGDSLTFPGSGVSQFTISGISPSIDGSSPTAFPIRLGLNRIGASIEASAFTETAPVPEPGSFGVVAAGIVVVGLARVRRGRDRLER